MAIKPKDLKFEEAALRKRLEFVRSLKAALSQEDSISTLTVESYTSIIDGTPLIIYTSLQMSLSLKIRHKELNIFHFYIFNSQKLLKKLHKKFIDPLRLGW